MNAYAQRFCDLLEQKDLHYEIVAEDESNCVVRCGMKMENTSLRVVCIFPNEGQYVWLRCFDFVQVPSNKMGNAMMACNSLNQNYKWVKFYVDQDGDVNLEDDAILDPNSDAEECFELMFRMMKIADEAYPIFMKAIYL